jgi:hypothetical protein
VKVAGQGHSPAGRGHGGTWDAWGPPQVLPKYPKLWANTYPDIILLLPSRPARPPCTDVVRCATVVRSFLLPYCVIDMYVRACVRARMRVLARVCVQSAAWDAAVRVTVRRCRLAAAAHRGAAAQRTAGGGPVGRLPCGCTLADQGALLLGRWGGGRRAGGQGLLTGAVDFFMSSSAPLFCCCCSVNSVSCVVDPVGAKWRGGEMRECVAGRGAGVCVWGAVDG